MSWFPTKPNEVPHTDEFLDDSAVGGVHCNKSLALSPKSPGDFSRVYLENLSALSHGLLIA